MVVPSAEGPEACEPMVEIFRLSFRYLEMVFVGKVLAKVFEKGKVVADKAIMKEAYDLGASL